MTKTRRGRSWRPGLAGQVFIGLGLGVATGLFFGERAAPLGIVGQAFIGLLQMTVLPYVVVSLSAGLGRLSYAEAKLLALRGGGFILLFWVITLVAVVGMALAFPAWKSATFFSPSLIEPLRQFDLLELYIPTNPFFSLANTIVPAVVVFSLALGIALMGEPAKSTLLPILQSTESVLLRIAVRLNRTRSPKALPSFRLKTVSDGLELYFPETWLVRHPLTSADLEEEEGMLSDCGIRLRVVKE